jgi:hypothetical protein
MTKIRTFEEAMQDLKGKAPDQAVFHVLGFELTLNKAQCKDYNSTCAHILAQAPEELIAQMNAMPNDDYIETLGALITNIYTTFGVPEIP